MKTLLDPRHKKRAQAVKDLFSWGFHSKKITKNKLAKSVLENLSSIDGLIGQSAPQWPLKQINRIDLAILRLAVWELAIGKKEPPKVIIDEAIELGKTYGSEKSPGFINGVLGTILKQLKK